jgi:hypothetical protein
MLEVWLAELGLAVRVACTLEVWHTEISLAVGLSGWLQARMLWLVGACGQDLPHEEWCSAYGLVVGHMASLDLVVSIGGAGL